MGTTRMCHGRRDLHTTRRSFVLQAGLIGPRCFRPGPMCRGGSSRTARARFGDGSAGPEQGHESSQRGSSSVSSASPLRIAGRSSRGHGGTFTPRFASRAASPAHTAHLSVDRMLDRFREATDGRGVRRSRRRGASPIGLPDESRCNPGIVVCARRLFDRKRRDPAHFKRTTAGIGLAVPADDGMRTDRRSWAAELTLA
jgi:hypothetical protein